MKKVNVKDLKKATMICKSFDAVVSFSYSSEVSGAAVHNRKININLHESTDLDWFYSLVFHEICHIRCLDEGKYMIYHDMTLPDKQMGVYVRKMGLRIERFVDRMAEEMMKEYMPHLKFQHSYLDKDGVNFFNKWAEEVYPL